MKKSTKKLEKKLEKNVKLRFNYDFDAYDVATELRKLGLKVRTRSDYGKTVLSVTNEGA